MLAALIIGVTFGALSGVAARSRGRNSLGWFLAGILVGPFSLVVALLPPVPREGVTVECPSCAEVLRFGARACPRCGQQLLGAGSYGNAERT
jgi:hypothetical protein